MDNLNRSNPETSTAWTEIEPPSNEPKVIPYIKPKGGPGMMNGNKTGRGFDICGQPPKALIIAGKRKAKTMKDLLNLAITKPEKFRNLKSLQRIMPELELKGITLEQAMDMVLIMKTIQDGNPFTYAAVKDRAHGRPKQAVDIKDVRIKVTRTDD
jgi:hypothetical protein